MKWMCIVSVGRLKSHRWIISTNYVCCENINEYLPTKKPNANIFGTCEIQSIAKKCSMFIVLQNWCEISRNLHLLTHFPIFNRPIWQRVCMHKRIGWFRSSLKNAANFFFELIAKCVNYVMCWLTERNNRIRPMDWRCRAGRNREKKK